MWKSQDQEIATAVVQVSHFIAPPRQDLIAVDVLARLAHFESISTARDGVARIEALKPYLLSAPTRDFQPYWRDRVQLYIAGTRLREEVFHSIPPYATEVTVLNGHEELDYQSLHKQYAIHAGRTAKKVTTLDSIRPFPTKVLKDLNIEMAVATSENGLTTFSLPDVQIVVTPESGYVHRISISEQGAPRFEMRQYGQLTLPSVGYALPLVSVQISFPNGRMGKAEFFVVEDMEANIDIPESMWTIAAAENGRIVDYRSDPKFPQQFLAVAPVADIVAYVHTAKPLTPSETGAPDAPREWSWRTYLAITSLTLLVIAGTYFIGRRIRSGQ